MARMRPQVDHQPTTWTFDPDNITLTRHVLRRYMERRHVNDPHLAAMSIRALLLCVAHQRPTLKLTNGHTEAARHYRAPSGMVWVVSADGESVITFYDRSKKGR